MLCCGSGSIHNSSFTGNSAGLDGNQIYAQGWTINAQQNWWGADGIPNVADSGSGTSIITSSALINDPTLPNPVTGLYDVAACEPVPPEPVPSICPQGVMFQNGGVTIQQEICVVPTNTPTSTPTPTATPDPALPYYKRFEGLMFWIMYNETSQNIVEDQFDIVETAANNGSPTDPNRVVLVPSSASFPREQRGVRYLFVRTILNNIPDYIPGSEAAGYEGGYAYGRNWGGSINDPNNTIWSSYQGCPDTHGWNYNGGTLPSYSSIYNGTALQILDWFSDYASCRAAANPNFQPHYQMLISVIGTATQHHITNTPNPAGNAYYIRNANSCFVSDPPGGACITTNTIQAWCTGVGRNCRSANVYVEEVSNGPVGVTVTDWYNYNQLLSQYHTPIAEPQNLVFNPTYLFDPLTSGNPQQITYNSQVGVHYHISTGLYDVNSQARYFLMGIGASQFSETIEAAFARHWNRLNRDRTPVNPETLYPSTCINAAAHITFGQGAFQTWATYIFQAETQTPGGDIWFCAAP